MAAQSLLAKLGMRTGTLGTAASLAIAAPLAEGDVSMAAHDSPQRIGWYFDRSVGAEKIGTVVKGTEVLSLTANAVTAGVTVFTPASSSVGAGLNIGQGVAPSAPQNGDLWITPAGMFAYVNGAVAGPFGSGGGSGTVTSVGLSLPSIFSVTGSPVTTSGTLTGSFNTQSPNLVFAGPASGGAATPTFRSLVAADLPAGTGTVTSVGVTSTDLSVSGSPVTSSGNITLNVAAGAITLAKMANLAANSIIGNNTGSPAIPLALTTAQVTAMLNPFTSLLQGVVPASGGGTTNFLRADGTWAAAGSGSVTSVALALPSIFTVTGSPVTTSGTLTGSFNTQSPNLVFAGPSSGGAATPTFRALVAADLPAGTGTIGGSIASTQVAVGSGTNTIAGSSTLTWSSANGISSNRAGTTHSEMFGLLAGNTTMSGTDNTCVGWSAGTLLTSGQMNTLVGSGAGFVLAGGSNNVFVGEGAGFSATGSDYNTAVGTDALVSAVGGGTNVAIGAQAGQQISSGYGNTVLGMGALNGLDTGSRNIAIGRGAGTTRGTASPATTNTMFIGDLSTNSGADVINNVYIDSSNTWGVVFRQPQQFASTTAWVGRSAPSVSAGGSGVIYFDSGSNTFKVSENGGAYVNLVGGGSGTIGGSIANTQIAFGNSTANTIQGSNNWTISGSLMTFASGTTLVLNGAQGGVAGLHIDPQAAPSSPTSGDIWVTSTAFVVKTLSGTWSLDTHVVRDNQLNSFTVPGQTFAPADGVTASINLQQGTAPASPTNGDVWTTASGLAVKVSGGTFLLDTHVVRDNRQNSFTVPNQVFAAADGVSPSINLPQGTAPASPANGDVWTTASGFAVKVSGGTFLLDTHVVRDNQVNSFSVPGQNFAPANGSVPAINIGQGTAPSVPANGDLWATSQGLAIKVSGGTFLLDTHVVRDNQANTFTVQGQTFAAANGVTAPLNIPQGIAPATPTNGDLWTTSAGLFVRIAGTTVGPLAAASSGITGTIATDQVAFGSGTNAIQGSSKIKFTTANGLDVNMASSGLYNVTVGYSAGSAMTSGTNNTYIGNGAGASCITNGNNTGIGSGALGQATSDDNTAVGKYAGYGITTSSGCVAVGEAALYSGGSGVGLSTAVGYNALQFSNTGVNTALGNGAGATLTVGTRNTIIGSTADVGALNLNDTIALGHAAKASASNTFVVGSTTSAITNVYFGNGDQVSAPAAVTINAPGGLGTNVAGAALNVAGGIGTGTGVGGAINFRTAVASGSGSATPNALVTRVSVLQDGSLDWTGIATTSQPAVSAGSHGTIFYDSTLQKFRYSANGAAYADLVSGGGGTIGGSIASGQVAYGSGVNTIQGSATFTHGATTGLVLAPTAVSSGTQVAMTITGAANTGMTASTEVIDVNFNLARTVQWSTGAITTQRAHVIQAPTYAFVAGSTITNAATFAVTNAPAAGTNATITNAYSIWSQAGRAQFDANLNTGIGMGGTINDYHEINNQNTNNGTTASSDLVATADTGSATTNYVDLGINGSGYTAGVFGAALEGYLYTSDQNLNIGTAAAAKVVNVLAGGSSTTTNKVFSFASTVNTSSVLLQTVASTTSSAGLNIPHGAAPTSPVNGDVWTTTSAMFVRINGVTQQLSTATGTIGGSIAANQVAFGSGSNTIQGSTTLTYTATTGLTIAQTAVSTGTQNAFVLTGASNTGMTASTEVSDATFNLTRTVQWATGAIGTQRAIQITAPTYAFVGASTISNAATFAIAGSPIAGTNATITNSYSFWVQAGQSQLDGQVSLGNVQVTGSTGQLNIAPVVAGSSGTPKLLTVTGPANTNMTLSTEVNDVNINLNRTVQWATGAIATQRAVVIQAPTYAFVGASTITTASTLSVTGAPAAGTNATLTNKYAINVEAGAYGGPAGTAALPTYTVGQANTGMYSTAAGFIGLSSAGTLRLTIDATAFTGTLPWRGQNGTAAAPALSFSGATTMGWFGSGSAGTGVVGLGLNGVEAMRFQVTSTQSSGNVNIAPATVSSGAACVLRVVAAADTAQTLSTESSSVIFDLSATRQFATGALATQRALRIAAPTYSFVGASTITTAATVAISGAPIAGTNATLTSSYAFWVQAGQTELDGQLAVAGSQVSGSTAQVTIAPSAIATSGTPKLVVITAAANTGMTAATEVIDVNINLARTTQWATGAITTQRAMVVQAPTYSAVGASSIANAATLAITNSPQAGTNMSISNAWAIWVQNGNSKFDTTTDATAIGTGAITTPGGISANKSIVCGQNLTWGVSSFATAGGTTSLSSAANRFLIFTGSTTQTLQLPAANAFGAGQSVCYIVINRSSGTVTAQRAGSDTFAGGATTDAIGALAQRMYVSDGVSVWYNLNV